MKSIETSPVVCLPLVILATAVIAGGCAPKVRIITGTTIGLKASPGDGQTSPPQVTLAYKRSEFAAVPTKGQIATETNKPDDVDAFSVMASFYFETLFFGSTEIDSFIATGHAARGIQGETSVFNETFAEETLKVVSAAIQERRVKLARSLGGLSEDQAQSILDEAGLSRKAPKTAKQSLQDAIRAAQSDAAVTRLEKAFARLT